MDGLSNNGHTKTKTETKRFLTHRADVLLHLCLQQLSSLFLSLPTLSAPFSSGEKASKLCEDRSPSG